MLSASFPSPGCSARCDPACVHPIESNAREGVDLGSNRNAKGRMLFSWLPRGRGPACDPVKTLHLGRPRCHFSATCPKGEALGVSVGRGEAGLPEEEEPGPGPCCVGHPAAPLTPGGCPAKPPRAPGGGPHGGLRSLVFWGLLT